MPVTTTLVFAIRLLARAERREGSVQLTFGDGSVAYLEEAHPHFDALRVVVESQSRRLRPVGVLLDGSGRVIDVNEANDVTVRSIRENEDTPDRLKVALWGFSPICYLARDHPEFERLRSTLSAVVGTPARLWVANHSQMVQAEPATEGGEFEIWWKILDVRLAESPPGTTRRQEPFLPATATRLGDGNAGAGELPLR